MGKLTGRVEGAYLSGSASAKTILDKISAPCCPPDSWEGPLNVDGPSKARGMSSTLGQDLPVYYTPPTDPASKLAVVVFEDVWGHTPRFLSICDALAEKGGFHVIAPDCLRGKSKADIADQDMLAWLQQYPYDDLLSKDIDDCFKFLKSKGVESFGALGFCWGGWAIAKSSAMGVPWKAGVSPHPSTGIEKRVFGRDEEEMLRKVAMPFCLLPAGNDAEHLKPGSDVVKELEKKGGKSVLFENMLHGWTTRSDLSNATVKKDTEEALSIALDFLVKHVR